MSASVSSLEHKLCRMQLPGAGLSSLSFSLIQGRNSQQAIAQLIGEPRYLRFNVLNRETRKSNHLLMSMKM